MHASKLTHRIIRRHVRNNSQILDLYLTSIELDNTKMASNERERETKRR